VCGRQSSAADVSVQLLAHFGWRPQLSSSVFAHHRDVVATAEDREPSLEHSIEREPTFESRFDPARQNHFDCLLIHLLLSIKHFLSVSQMPDRLRTGLAASGDYIGNR
jgi:hypothetical protein